MINLTSSITSFSDGNFEDYLTKLAIIDIFKGIIDEYPILHKEIIKYIVFANSVDSELVTVGEEWLKNKKRIYEHCMLPPTEELMREVIFLEKDIVRETTRRWLDFQDDETFTELQMLKELKIEMQISSNSQIRKSSGEIDYDQKLKNAEYSIKLNGYIKDAQSNLIQNNIKLKESHKEAFSNGKKSKTSFGVESFAKRTA